MEIKPLPQDDTLECGILGGIIFNLHKVDEAHEIIEKLDADMFINPVNKSIFRELQESVFRDKKIGQPKALTELNGTAIASYVEVAIMHFHLEKSIEDLKEIKLRREMITKSRELEQNAYEPSVHKDDLIEKFNSAATEISGLKNVDSPTTMSVIKEAVGRVQEAVNGQGNERVKYCHPDIDDKITIFRKQIHTYGGDQGGGKTALALDCFRRQIKAGLNVVYFCTESSADELLLRMIGSEIEVDMESILTGSMTPAIMARFKQSIENFKSKHENFWIIGLGDWQYTAASANSILSKIYREAGHIEMCWFDFLQDMHAPKTKRHVDIIEAIQINVAGIKATTERHNCASTILSQFRKERSTSRPRKQDFWGSSSIIDASHIMSCLHGEQAEDNAPQPEVREIWWYSVKTRLIRDWSKPLMFKGSTGTFHSVSRYQGDDRPNAYNPGGK